MLLVTNPNLWKYELTNVHGYTISSFYPLEITQTGLNVTRNSLIVNLWSSDVNLSRNNKSLQPSAGTFSIGSTIGKTTAAIEANNDTYCLEITNRKVPAVMTQCMEIIVHNHWVFRRKDPYLKQALSQKTWFCAFLVHFHKNAHIFMKMHAFYAN